MDSTAMGNRRQFVHQVGGAAAIGAIAGLAPVSRAAEPTTTGDAKAAAKSNIRIGTRISPDWLLGEQDNHLRFLKQIGVDAVDIELIMVPGYKENGIFSRTALRDLIARFAAAGLRIERANALGPMLANAHLNRPEGQQEIDKLKRIGELVVEAEIPILGIQACQATQHVAGQRGGWSRQQGRGGYDYPAFDLAASQSPPPKTKYAVTADQLWTGLLNIYRQVMPIVEGSKTRIAMHGNDPPLYEFLGSPQILCRFADFDRLFREVPSKHNGITFCVGTRYESGEDVLAGIRHFGKQGKLFHVHFRNVRGTLPAKSAYAEVFPDDGDLNMAAVLRTLDEVGYDGVIDYDHPIRLAGDDPLAKQYIAFNVGYMRGLIQSLNVK